MSQLDRLPSHVREQLERPPHNRGQAAVLVRTLVEWLDAQSMSIAGCKEIVDAVRQYCATYGFDDLLANQMAYAVRLASAPRDLEYEEIHKLFSLCDEIEALRLFGFDVSEPQDSELFQAITGRFQRQPTKAKQVAKEIWKNRVPNRWWYLNALRAGSDQ
jgi:hypothetical protein